MQAPLIHLNGSSKQTLMEQLSEAGLTLNRAIDALHEMAPHGRDYYPLGDDAYYKAAKEHSARIAKVREVYEEIAQLALAVAEQPGKYEPNLSRLRR